jgi:superfamily II DNA or RNA helicase
MACGTGKTLVGLLVAETLEAERTLVLVPSLSLLAQTLREWTANSEQEFEFLAVCSDETVVGEDAVVSTTSELGFPVTTDPAQIASFLASDSIRGVVFATYQSSPRIADAARLGVPSFDLVIADESHRCAGPEAGVFATVLDDARIPARRRLFMTATPKYYTERLLREAGELEFGIASMDDQAMFGPVFYRLAFGEAIANDLLSDYQVVVVGVSDSTYREYAENGAFVTTDGATVTDARSLASQLGLLRAMAAYDLRRVVSFHSRIASAQTFSSTIEAVCEWLPDDRRPSGRLWARHVSGQMSSGERDRRLEELRTVGPDQRGLLSSARCLAEGVDVPTLDGIAFIEPRRSQIDIVQAVGRAIRKARDKTIGTVVIPVFVDQTSDPGAVVEASEFERVWQVLKALRAHDETLGEELDELRRELGRRKTTVTGRPNKIRLDLPVSVGEDFARAFDVRLVTETTSTWEFWYGLLERFVDREGHAQVPLGNPPGHLEDGYRLGQWVAVQRKLHKRLILDPRRRQLLELLPGWTWAPFASRWEEGYARLEAFGAREGHTRVPTSHQEDGFPLGRWVAGQRGQRRQQKLSPDRLAQLEALPGWVWNRFEASWEDGFALLRAYVAKEGHARPATSHREQGFLLGSWCSDQRKQYKRGNLDPEKANRLEGLPGWVWRSGTELAPRRSWEQAYHLLERFAEHAGHTRVPSIHIEEGFRLGPWVADQRKAHRQDKLSVERTTLLESLPGWRWSHEISRTAWEEALSHLERFVAREGHALVPQQHVEAGLKLGHWTGRQRAEFAEGALAEQRARRLESIPGWTWDANEALWDLNFRALQSFVNREGHARVPIKHVEGGVRLGQWVGVQRRAAREEKLDRERLTRLESIPGWLWDVPTALWEDGFTHLTDYASRLGTANVPSTYRCDDGYSLGQWVANRRADLKRDDAALTEERRRRLEALPGWVWSSKRERGAKGREKS